MFNPRFTFTVQYTRRVDDSSNRLVEWVVLPRAALFSSHSCRRIALVDAAHLAFCVAL